MSNPIPFHGTSVDDRAVSTVLSYTLTLGISSLLVIGLLVATGGFANDHRQETIRDEMEVIGQQIASDLSAADRLVRTADTSNPDVRVERSFPNEVTGIDYQIEVDGSTEELVLTTDDPEITVTVQVTIQTDLASNGGLQGGDIVIEYDGGPQELVMNDG